MPLKAKKRRNIKYNERKNGVWQAAITKAKRNKSAKAASVAKKRINGVNVYVTYVYYLSLFHVMSFAMRKHDGNQPGENDRNNKRRRIS